MAKVAQGQQIPLHSAIFQAGLNQFEQNIGLLLEKYRTAGIPVYIATIGSNIADQPPFTGAALTEIQRGKLAQFQAQLDAGVKITELTSAIERLVQGAAADSAALFYQVGQLYRRAGATEQARRWLVAAKDADTLRFRAPEAINQHIRTLATQPGVVVVDVEAAWRRHSEQGLIGKPLMLEHLHPNAKGYFLLADSFYQVLAAKPPLPNWPGVVSSELAWAERPLLPAEEYAAELRVLTLTADYPFQASAITISHPEPQNLPQQLGQAYFNGKLDWLGMMQQSARYYQQQGNGDMLLKALLLVADALPHDAHAKPQAATILQQAGGQYEAAHDQRRAERAVSVK
jgi:lysophospholipase L1-like esterase